METALINGNNLETEDVAELTAFFEDGRSGGPDRELQDREQVLVLQDRLSMLPKREADMLRYRYGLNEHPVLTLEEIGKVFGLTRERVRQLEVKSLARLRELISSEAVL
jgi:RNA polymerase primary sigma factor